MFKLEEFMGKRVLKSSFIEDENVCAFFTTRDLPLKSGERDDLIEKVEKNKKLVCEGLDIPRENLIIPVQTHSDNIESIKSSSPLTLHASPENVDALVTNQTNVALALNFADCVPIILYDPNQKVVAIAHAGWRGTAAKIASKTVEKMVEAFDVNPQNIIALIGPCIGKCCFEVKEDVAGKLLQSIPLNNPAVEQVCPTYTRSSRFTHHSSLNIDLKQINKLQLLASGVIKIDLCEYCTCCDSELFFSYRRENGKTARHSAVIMLRETEISKEETEQ